MRWRDLALRLIALYQRHLSPHKGFACAYRVHTGRASCSTLGLRAIRRHGLRRGLGVLDLRLHCCAEVHHSRRSAASARLHREAGLCDIGCDGFDLLPDGNSLSPCDCLDVCDCCDWRKREARSGRRSRRK